MHSRTPPHCQMRKENSRFSVPQKPNWVSYPPILKKKALSAVKRPPACPCTYICACVCVCEWVRVCMCVWVSARAYVYIIANPRMLYRRSHIVLAKCTVYPLRWSIRYAYLPFTMVGERTASMGVVRKRWSCSWIGIECSMRFQRKPRLQPMPPNKRREKERKK